MSDLCNTRICAIAILTVCGYLVTLTGSANALSTTVPYNTRSAVTNSAATDTRRPTTLPPKYTTKNDDIPTSLRTKRSTSQYVTPLSAASTKQTITTVSVAATTSTEASPSSNSTPPKSNMRTTSPKTPENTKTTNTKPGTPTGSTTTPSTPTSAKTTMSTTSPKTPEDDATTNTKPGTPTGSTTTPSTPTSAKTTMSTTSTKTPEDNTTTNTKPGTPTGSTTTPSTPTSVYTTMNPTSPKTPKDNTATNTKPGTPTESTTTPSTPTSANTTMITTSPKTPKDNMTTNTKPGTPTGSTTTISTPTSVNTTMNPTSPKTPKDNMTTNTKPGTLTGSTTTPSTSTPANTTMNPTSPKTRESTSRSPPRLMTSSPILISRSTGTSPKPTTLPNYPAPKLANIESDDAVKTIGIEIAVSEVSSHGCNPTNNKSCETFISKVKEEFTEYYKNIEGFFKVEVTHLRDGSIIVEHNVIYKYNEMKPEERDLSAQEVYDSSIGPGVADGQLGNLTVSTCNNCKQPKDHTNLCNFNVDCDVLIAECREGYVYCISPCEANPSFCSSRGDCSQDEGAAAKCSCHPVENGSYFGDNCEHYFNQTIMIVCIAVAGGFIFGIAVACVLTRCRRKKTLGRYRQYYMDDMGEEGYLWNESYALEGAQEGEEDLIDLTADEDDPKIEFSFNSSLTPHID